MKGIKHLAAVAQQYHWLRVAALGIAQHANSAEGDVLKGEVVVPGCLDGWAVVLGLGDGGVVQRLPGGRHGSNRCFCLLRARQGVCHHVVLTGNVPDVTCEFGHLAEVAALARRPRLRHLGEGVGEWLVVRVEREPPPFQHEAEVADPLHAG